ncbi:MAG: insulinase family protein [Treponema sp.]|nr:insulinase family protein [Treponema sp.]
MISLSVKKRPAFLTAGAIVAAILIFNCATTPRANFGGLGKASDPVPLTSRAITGILPNGLRYYILENRRPENRAHLALAVKAGSVLEKDDERGFAHFVEHLAFNNTARFPKLELIEYLRSLGMRFGPDVNAYTSYDETVYGFDVPVEIINGVKSIPPKALAIIDDWSYAVSITPEDVAGESQVIMEEYRTRLGAMDRVRRITLPILFSGSQYANRQPIGLPEIIENAAAGQLTAFYKRWYTSDNMAIIFVGDFDGKALETSLAEHFTMPAAEKPVDRPVYKLPPPKKGNFHVEYITDPELTSVSISVYYKQKTEDKNGTVGYYRQTVIDYLISTMLNLRFEEALSKPQAAAVEAWGGTWNWSEDARFYVMGTQPKTANTAAALRDLLLEKESIRRHGFTEDELFRAKLRLIAFMDRQLSEKDNQNSRVVIQSFTSHYLKGDDMADIEWEVDAINLLLPYIGTREISNAAKKYFSYNDCVVFITAPEDEELPSGEQVKNIFAETARVRIETRSSATLSGDILNTVPSPGIIVSEAADSETGALIWRLNNGATVILKKTENKSNEVILYAIAKGGTANAAENEAVSAGLASEMISVSGLGEYSRTELINKLAGKQVSMSLWAADHYRGFQGSSTSNDLKTMFELLYLGFTNPRIDDDAVAAMIDQYRTNLARQEDNPERVFYNEITKTINNYQPRFMPLELADMDKVSIDQASAFIGKCLNPGDYTFVLTGNLDIDVTRELICIYLASIPNSAPMNSWTDPGILRPDQTEKMIYKGVDQRSMVYLGWFSQGSPEFSEERNQSAAILSEYLDIILTDEIREKMGGVYSIHAGASVSTIPNGEARLSIYFYCNPERAAELIGAVKEQITQAAGRPLVRDTFDKSREALIKEHETAIQRNLHIAQSYANSSALYNTPLSRLDSRPAAIMAVTPEDVQALCKMLLGNGPVQIVLYPEDWGN